jgi:hypothetical protein
MRFFHVQELGLRGSCQHYHDVLIFLKVPLFWFSFLYMTPGGPGCSAGSMVS